VLRTKSQGGVVVAKSVLTTTGHIDMGGAGRYRDNGRGLGDGEYIY